MKIAVFSNKPYTERSFRQANEAFGHELVFFEERLNAETVSLANGSGAVCVFVNDELHAEVIKALSELGVQLIALRCAGFNNVDLAAAEKWGLSVVRVPAYSPYAVAEHTVGLILALNRQIYRAHMRVREGNFSLEGLLGFDLHGTTAGIVGTGKIGSVVARILNGFGCILYAYDLQPNPECLELGVRYVSMDDIYRLCRIITLHCPLTPQTYHLINAESIAKMQDGVMLINTSRGALVDTRAAIEGLKSGKIGYLGLDVYEEEADLFFEDLSNQIIQDDVFARLLMFPNVVVTGHQAFFTQNALTAIAETTLANVSAFERGECQNIVLCQKVVCRYKES
ncbi:MAG TPA: 2-hydroxyacid dehydrogenase [Anaerohalosphaeraceae bacterium]|nr:2-hydroxyacid dehydrogenase [Anaerohalosphaeraceae bacterium]